METVRRSFTDEFKAEATALLESSGRPLQSDGQELGIQPSMLRAWHKRLGQAGEIARLKRENDRLRMEKEILKNTLHYLGACEMRFRTIEDLREKYPVRVFCGGLDISPSGYSA